VGSTETRYTYAPSGQLMAEGSTKQYVYLNGQVVAYINNNVLYYVHNDHLGRPEVITNSSKSIVWKAKLDNFNRSVQSTSIGEFNLGLFQASCLTPCGLSPAMFKNVLDIFI
jgi:uncharacterized protein RhaS with RHS repeats